MHSWKGHRGRALASGYQTFQGNAYFMSGGSDDVLAIWDVKDCLAPTKTGAISLEGICVVFPSYIKR